MIVSDQKAGAAVMNGHLPFNKSGSGGLSRLGFPGRGGLPEEWWTPEWRRGSARLGRPRASAVGSLMEGGGWP